MTAERYEVTTSPGLEVSLKDTVLNNYPFSLACENLDEFEPLITEIINVCGLLNEKESEILRLNHIITVLTEENMRLKSNGGK